MLTCRSALLILLALGAGAAEPAKPMLLPTPPQDQGLPYTRSGFAQARAALMDLVAIHVHSRYAWVEGHRVRLDDERWQDEPIERDSVVVASRWANEVAGAGSVKSSAGT